MIVTDKQFALNNFLVRQCTLIAKRISGKSKLDALIIIDGDEGYGKTTLAVQLAYFVAYTSGRQFPFDCSNLFFDIDKMIKFATETKDQIIVWDEAALGGLSTEGYLKTQIKLLKLLMVARKKRHFYIFNIPKFYRLREGIVDRALALIHVYARNEVELGRFVYYTKAMKEALYNAWRTSKRKQYKKYAKLMGTFGDHLSKVIDEEIYDKMKDEAIMSIANEPVKVGRREAKAMRYLGMFTEYMKRYNISEQELASHFGVGLSTLQQWKRYADKEDD